MGKDYLPTWNINAIAITHRRIYLPYDQQNFRDKLRSFWFRFLRTSSCRNRVLFNNYRWGLDGNLRPAKLTEKAQRTSALSISNIAQQMPSVTEGTTNLLEADNSNSKGEHENRR